MKTNYSANKSPSKHCYGNEHTAQYDNPKKRNERQQDAHTQRHVITPSKQGLFMRAIDGAVDIWVLHKTKVICRPFMHFVFQFHRSLHHVI